MRTSFMDKEHRAVADLVKMPGRPGSNNYLLTRINVPKEHRRKGIGTKLLKQVVDEADSTGATLVVDTLPSGDMSFVNLGVWYMKHGFRYVIMGRMIRSPRIDRELR